MSRGNMWWLTAVRVWSDRVYVTLRGRGVLVVRRMAALRAVRTQERSRTVGQFGDVAW